MIRYIDEHRGRFGVEPICSELPIAVSTYYKARSQPPSARTVRDAELTPAIKTTWEDNYKVYGARKVWLALRRQGVEVGRDRVARLMKVMGIAGAVRTRRVRTTRPDPSAARAPDLVGRNFTAARPNQTWVADFTHVPTWAGIVYVAFVVDMFSRFILGWRAATTMRTELVLDALEMAIWRRSSDLHGLVAHSDAGSQYTSIRYTERLAEIGAAPSIGSVGDPVDNAVAESTIGLYKTELIRRRGPWRDPDQVELETLGWTDWFNHTRLHSTTLDLPPAEYETIWTALAEFSADMPANRPPESSLRASDDPRGAGHPATDTPDGHGSVNGLVVPGGVGRR